MLCLSMFLFLPVVNTSEIYAPMTSVLVWLANEYIFMVLRPQATCIWPDLECICIDLQ